MCFNLVDIFLSLFFFFFWKYLGGCGIIWKGRGLPLLQILVFSENIYDIFLPFDLCIGTGISGRNQTLTPALNTVLSEMSNYPQITWFPQPGFLHFMGESEITIGKDLIFNGCAFSQNPCKLS